MKKIIKIFSTILAVIMVLSSTSVAFAYTQTYSKYDDKTYTHNTRFDALPKVIGIDVSEHNKTIDFNKVKADGIDFVYVRVGYTGYTKSKLSLNYDPYYPILQMRLLPGFRLVFIGIRRQLMNQKLRRKQICFLTQSQAIMLHCLL